MSNWIVKNKSQLIYGVLTIAITFIITMSCWRLWGTDIKIPLTGYRHDSVGVLLEASNYVKGGSLHSCIRYGAPYVGEYVDGGFGDSSVPMPLIKFICRLTGSFEAGINIHAIINILLLAVSMFWVCTRYKISNFISMIAGISYAESAFFLMYGNTLLMIYSFCFYIPLFCHLLIEIMTNDSEKKSSYTITWKQLIFTIAVMLCMGINSAYYAFMAMIILALIALHALFATKRPDRVMLVILSYLSIGAGIAVYILPKIISSLGYSDIVVSLGAKLFVLLLILALVALIAIGALFRKITPHISMKVIYAIVAVVIVVAGAAYIVIRKYTDYIGSYEGRTWLAVEMGALRIINMIMPAPNNMVSSAETMVESLVDVNAGDYTVFGILSGIGYLYSVLNIFQFKKEKHEMSQNDKVLQICGLLNAFMTLVAVKGGLASVVAMFVTTGIRNYNRICVYVSVFSLIAFGILADRIYQKIKKYINEKYRIAAILTVSVVMVCALAVSIPTYFVYKNQYGIPPYEQRVAEYNEWHEIMDKIESSVSDGGMILQLPFSVSGKRLGVLMEDYGRAYDSQIPVILSQSTVWSFGGGHKASNWKRIARETKSIEELLILSSVFGFEGVYVDTLMYSDDSYKNVLNELESFLGTPYVCDDNRRYFFNMSEYNEKIVSEYGKERITEIIKEVEAQY